MPKLLPLTRGLYTLVDDADYPAASRHKWHVASCGYVKRSEAIDGHARNGYRSIFLHRELTGAQRGDVVDHINHDPLDNRRSVNLRVVDASRNAHNRRGADRTSHTGVLGVGKYKNRYRARIRVNRKLIYLGSFLTAEAASEAVERARQDLVWSVAPDTRKTDCVASTVGLS